MNQVSHIGELPPKICDTFQEAILDIAREHTDHVAIAEQRLFEAILLRELPQDYLGKLAVELEKYGLRISLDGNTSPILCQNVPGHRDKIRGPKESIVINVSQHIGDLCIHDTKGGEAKKRIPLTRGKIFQFNHHDLVHSVQYSGKPRGFLMVVRASVEALLY